MALIPPFFLDCVVAIGSRRGEKLRWSASGFLYGHFVSADGDRSAYGVYLITNRHVFDHETEVVLRFNPAGIDPAHEIDLPLVDASGAKLWLAHHDPDIDAAVMPINAQALEEGGIQFAFFRSHQHVLDRQGAVDKGLSEGDGAYILGFPMGIVGRSRSYVIVRQGSLARVRDWLGGSSKDFLVDATIFPGNSGGPVVNRPENTAITGTQQQGAAYLIGIVKSYVPYQDIAISQQTNRPRVIIEENSGLAAVVPMDYVIEVIAAHRATLGPPPTSEETSVPPEQAPPDHSGDEVVGEGAAPSTPGKTPKAKPSRRGGQRRSIADSHPASGTTPTAMTQPVTATDISNGRIRIPQATKPIFPSSRADLAIILRGAEMTVPYDPRNGPDRSRSGVLRIGKERLGGLVGPRERLSVSKSDGMFILE